MPFLQGALNRRKHRYHIDDINPWSHIVHPVDSTERTGNCQSTALYPLKRLDRKLVGCPRPWWAYVLISDSKYTKRHWDLFLSDKVERNNRTCKESDLDQQAQCILQGTLSTALSAQERGCSLETLPIENIPSCLYHCTYLWKFSEHPKSKNMHNNITPLHLGVYQNQESNFLFTFCKEPFNSLRLSDSKLKPPWHLTFHELLLGMQRNPGLYVASKSKLKGNLQCPWSGMILPFTLSPAPSCFPSFYPGSRS